MPSNWILALLGGLLTVGVFCVTPVVGQSLIYVDASDDFVADAGQPDGFAFGPNANIGPESAFDQSGLVNRNDGLWHLRDAVGSDGPSGRFIWEATGNVQAGDTGEDVPLTTQTISGLTPSASYKVYAAYWASDGESWTIRTGVSPGSLTLYDRFGTQAGGTATPGILASTRILDHAADHFECAGLRRGGPRSLARSGGHCGRRRHGEGHGLRGRPARQLERHQDVVRWRGLPSRGLFSDARCYGKSQHRTDISEQQHWTECSDRELFDQLGGRSTQPEHVAFDQRELRRQRWQRIRHRRVERHDADDAVSGRGDGAQRGGRRVRRQYGRSAHSYNIKSRQRLDSHAVPGLADQSDAVQRDRPDGHAHLHRQCHRLRRHGRRWRYRPGGL